VIVAERFAVTTFCRSFADMPTQSRGHGTRRPLPFGDFWSSRRLKLFLLMGQSGTLYCVA
jgi:hypothetical protein